MKEPLYERIYKRLSEDIRTSVYKEGEKLPTEKELMKTFDVSRVTVQKAVGMLAEEELVIRIIGRGTFVKSDNLFPGEKRSLVVGLLLGPSQIFGLDFLNALERIASRLGWNVVLKNTFNSKAEEEKAIRELMNFGIDGCIIQPVTGEIYSNDILKLVLSGVPVVLVDRNLRGLSASFVGSDNALIIQDVLQILFDKGHRVVSYVTSRTEDTSSLEDRLAGFNQFYVQSKTVNPDLNLFIRSNHEDYDADAEILEEDRGRIRAHLSEHPEITCLITSEYFISLLVREAVVSLGLKIPEDVSLITFDNIRHFPDRSVNCIVQDEEQMAASVAEQLTKLLHRAGGHIKIYCNSVYVDYGSVRNLGEPVK